MQMAEPSRWDDVRFARILRSSQIAIAVSTLAEGRFLDVNDGFESLLGYSRAMVIGRTSDELELAIDPLARAHLLTELADGRPVNNLEVRIRTRGGDIRWMLATVTVTDSGDGPVLVSQFFDVTDRHSLVEQLRESRGIFHAAFDNAAIGMAMVASDGQLLKINAAFCRLTGYSESEMLRMTFVDITHPDDIAADHALSRRLFRGELSSFQLEKRYLRKSGEVIWVYLNAALVRDASGAPRFAVSQVEDITARKQAELALRGSEERLRVLIEQLPAVVYMVDCEEPFTPLYMSPVVDDLLGPEGRTTFFANRWHDRIHPEDVAAVDAEFQRSSDDGLLFRSEYRFRKDDGSYIWLRDESRRLFDGQGTAIAWQGIFYDITDQREYQGQLEQARNAAEESNRLKSAFLSTMSHELRTPMNAIIGYSNLLLEGLEGSLRPGQRDAIQQVAGGADRLLDLINTVLDLSRVEAGGIDLANEPVDLAETLASVETELAPLAAAKRLGIQIRIAPGLPPVWGDAARVRQILLNLLGNAIKFTGAGGVSVQVCHRAEAVRIAVHDTGIGIDPQVLPHVFEEFRQADPSTTRRYGGSGLGLSIARRLAELHGGTIEVESTPGEGSTFTLVLPLVPESSIAAADQGVQETRRGDRILPASG